MILLVVIINVRRVATIQGECPKPRLTCCDEGFTAQKGWDAVSGVGSPQNWEKLEAALVAL